ncbi:unnamed protein product [Zymoseptoria tritici ST99CH_1E4]|uniref:Transcription regulator Rua1 C-terminal domain-containing protein n=1 Tax=Zymoseptoria tritici ST99CH_1E4 TaxID=1276532 RepID=A0A2H1FL44_ZYMTR|nr:unnamed protein product [Zymoseptoria tritici ST99CH_1E4]
MYSSYAAEPEQNWQTWYPDTTPNASVASPWLANDDFDTTTYLNGTPAMDATARCHNNHTSPIQPLGTDYFGNHVVSQPWIGYFEPIPYEYFGMQRQNSSASSMEAGGFSQSSDDDLSTANCTRYPQIAQDYNLPVALGPCNTLQSNCTEQDSVVDHYKAGHTAVVEKPRSVGFACSDERQKVDPPMQADANEGPPRPHFPRWAGDEYNPAWIRGDGIERAGWCGLCPDWFKMKDSAYWYHMHYSHGISCATGKRYDPPEARRPGQGATAREALCGVCKRWIYIGRSDRPFFRHAYKCHAKEKPAILSSRTAPKSASPGRVSKRHGK